MREPWEKRFSTVLLFPAEGSQNNKLKLHHWLRGWGGRGGTIYEHANLQCIGSIQEGLAREGKRRRKAAEAKQENDSPQSSSPNVSLPETYRLWSSFSRCRCKIQSNILAGQCTQVTSMVATLLTRRLGSHCWLVFNAGGDK